MNSYVMIHFVCGNLCESFLWGTPAHPGQCKQTWAVPRCVGAAFTTSLHRTPWYAHHHSYFLHGISVDGLKGYEMYLQSRKLPLTSLVGRQGGGFTHSFSPYGPIGLSHSLCQQAFTDLELTLLLLCCIMSLLVIEFLLDWMKGFQVRIALWKLPALLRLESA